MLIFVHFYLQNKLLCNHLIRNIIAVYSRNSVQRGMLHLHFTHEEQMKQQTIGWKRPFVLNMHEQDTPTRVNMRMVNQMIYVIKHNSVHH